MTYIPYKDKCLECKQNGNQITVDISKLETYILPGIMSGIKEPINVEDILICIKYQALCSSSVCKEERGLAKNPCKVCKGTGMIISPVSSSVYKGITGAYQCDSCMGTGEEIILSQKEIDTICDSINTKKAIIVSKDKFFSMHDYYIKLNSYDLDELDLSEFNIDITPEEKDQWKLTGLNNRDFILCYHQQKEPSNDISIERTDDSYLFLKEIADKLETMPQEEFNKLVEQAEKDTGVFSLARLKTYVDRLVRQGYGDVSVYFDTEARTYDCHIVPIDSITLVPKEDPIVIKKNVLKHRGQYYLKQPGNCTDCAFHGNMCHNGTDLIAFGNKTNCLEQNTIWKAFYDIKWIDEFACSSQIIGNIFVKHVVTNKLYTLERIKSTDIEGHFVALITEINYPYTTIMEFMDKLKLATTEELDFLC